MRAPFGFACVPTAAADEGVARLTAERWVGNKILRQTMIDLWQLKAVLRAALAIIWQSLRSLRADSSIVGSATVSQRTSLYHALPSRLPLCDTTRIESKVRHGVVTEA